ncbi:MAG: transposase [Bacteroidales bacterium]|nr:transposase [Bacteroidales bacterium]
MSRRIFYNNRGVAHIYQRGLNMSVMFYSVKDVLVFYTLLYKYKNKHGIRVLGVVCMYNHYHVLIIARSQATISRFMCEFESAYSREFNKSVGIKGPLIKRAYGLSNKYEVKKQRDGAAYLYNNPVEKQLSVRAVDYRWNFLAYAKSDHPFSNKLILRKASVQMRRCLQEIDAIIKLGSFINYDFLKKWFQVLSRNEINQLIDYIIIKFKVVDYDELIRLYGSYEKMLIAFDSNTGSEHDFKEEYSEKSYKPYISLMAKLTNELGFKDPKEVLKLDQMERMKLCERLVRSYRAPRFIAETLLHLYTIKPKRNLK